MIRGVFQDNTCIFDTSFPNVGCGLATFCRVVGTMFFSYRRVQMSYDKIVNAAPFFNPMGTQDLSSRPAVREPVAIPTHCPKHYIFAEKGPVNKAILCSGASRSTIFGENTFDLLGKYATHSTVYANGMNEKGNQIVYERLVPTDAGPEANILLSIDVLPTTVNDYERNTDGSYKLDAQSGLPIVKGSPIPGFKAKWHVSYLNTKTAMADYGKATIVPGDQINGATTSQRIPIMQGKLYIGSSANNVGLRIWAPADANAAAFDKKIMQREKVYPFRVAVIRKNTKTNTSKVVETLFGEQSILTTFKQAVRHPTTTKQMSFGEIFVNSFQEINDTQFAPVYGDFSDVVVYHNNIKTLLTQFYAAEKAYIDAALPSANIKHDFPVTAGVVAGDEWLFNFISGQSSEAYRYHTFQLVNGGGSVMLTQNTNLFAGGSSDGTMTNEAFDDLVALEMEKYMDVNNVIHNTALNPESIVYDSGFSLDTKYALCGFISQRKDTFTALATHIHGEAPLTASEENARAVALRTRLAMYPESDYFGTEVMRGLVMGRSGHIRSSLWTERVSPLYEVAVKAADYMGASNRQWKSGKSFDGAPGSILDYLTNINIPYTPVSVRNRDWDAGMNWTQSYDMKSDFFPALKTVYSDDTSVLNSFFTALGICEVVKVCERAWRFYSGNSKLSNAQRAQRIDEMITRMTQGVFDDRFIIEPVTFYTEGDLQRGFSYSTRVKVYANNMVTVGTSFVQAYRMSDYAPTN